MEKKQKTALVLLILFVCGAGFCLMLLNKANQQNTSGRLMEGEYHSIVIDPGHGAKDPGKVENGYDEKDINLQIALKAKKLLTQAGYLVFLTREEDTGVNITGEADSFQKKEDMRQRVKWIEGVKPDLFISIHCNSYPGKTAGAQTFYSKEAEESKKLAEAIQKSLIQTVDPKNHRQPKPGDYYVLNQTFCPAVIVEAGFMSNPEELKKLLSEGYQEKLAAGILRGVLEYFTSIE